MAAEFSVVTPDFVNVTITTSDQKDAFSIEKRFQKGITIANLKGKLELVTGGNASTMKLELYSGDNVLLTALDNDNALFGSYPVDDGMRLHVIDNFVLKNEIGDFAEVDKFEISEEEYTKREDTVKKFLERNKLGKYNAEEMSRREEEMRKEEEADEKAAKAVSIGDRCEVKVLGQPVRRATIMFVGEVEFKLGWWIGVKYDEPLGKNDGMVNGKRYFDCPPKYGGFVKPINVTVGDFPEEPLDLDEI